MRHPCTRSLPRLAAAVLASCSDGTAPTRLGTCSTPPVISVTGTDPVIDWQPRCTVRLLQVAPLAFGFTGPNSWVIGARDTFEIAPPLRYGSLPANAIEFSAAQPLGRDTTYFAYVSTARTGGIILPGISAQSAPFTACGATSGGRCIATPEVFRDQTASGVRISATLDRTTIARGDTVIATVYYDNAGTTAASIPPVTMCGPTYPESYRDGMPKLLWESTCYGEPLATVTVPAGGRVTQQFATAAVSPQLVGTGLYCPRVGTYTVRFATRQYVGGLRVASNPLSLTVRENPALSWRCIPV